MSDRERLHPLTRAEYAAEIRALEAEVERLERERGVLEEEVARLREGT